MHQRITKGKVRQKYENYINHLQYMYEDDSDYPLSSLIESELAEMLQKAIEKLPPQCRKIFEMSRMESQTHEEIARNLGISINTVHIQIKSYSESTQTLTLEWNEAAKTETGINLIHGENDTIVIDRTETLTVIPDFDIDKSLFYNTMYKPDFLSIDIFYTPTVEMILK